MIYAHHYLCMCFHHIFGLYFPFLLNFLISDQRPPPGALPSAPLPPSSRHECLTGTAEDALQGAFSTPHRCWHAGIGYLCHSVWLQPLADPYAIYIVTGYLHNAGGEAEKAIREIVWSNQTFSVDNDGRCMTGNVFEVTVNDSESIQRRWPGCVTLHLLIDNRVFVTDRPSRGGPGLIGAKLCEWGILWLNAKTQLFSISRFWLFIRCFIFPD